MENYLEATQELGRQFYMDFQDKGKIVMMNLLKFKVLANYKNLPAIRPDENISGEAAYQLYMKGTLPELQKAGGRVIYYGRCNQFLIGPESENWDAILLVEHESVAKFMEFAQNKDYLSTLGHRTAALEDSRLLPSTAIDSLVA